MLFRSNHAQKSAFGVIALGFAAAFIFVFGGQFLSTVPSTKTIVANAQYTAYGLFNSIATPSAANVFSVFGSSEEPTQNIAPENTVVDVPKMDVVQGGIVVLPGATSRATIDYVKQAFSDDVSVKLDADKTSGVITPRFSEGGTEAYRFVVVPVRHMP